MISGIFRTSLYQNLRYIGYSFLGGLGSIYVSSLLVLICFFKQFLGYDILPYLLRENTLPKT